MGCRAALPVVYAQVRMTRTPGPARGHVHVNTFLPSSASFFILCFLFFCSGASGLVYQVAWVREFGNVFGNTVYSASLVVAVFMLGLGVGSYFVGVWADRRYAARPESLLRAYAWAELVIALLGAATALVLPQLGRISAAVSSYSRTANGWYELSTMSYLLRGAIAVVLLTPTTVVMGGTLTLLIRHLVRRDFQAGASRIALLYGVNTAGAALGCFLTDFLLVPAAGLLAAQFVAVALNLVAGTGAWVLSRRPGVGLTPTAARTRRGDAWSKEDVSATPVEPLGQSARTALALTGGALALTGFAAMGLEILWLRHFSLLLGQFRSVFSSVLTILLVGLGLGALGGGALNRRSPRPAQWLMLAQGGVVASALLGLARADVSVIHDAGRELGNLLDGRDSWPSILTELWFNAKPILLEVALPALLMGLAFPLGNAVVQRTESTVGRNAGALYFSNTIGSVLGSLVTGFMLLPFVGIQGTATTLAAVAALAIVPLHLVARSTATEAAAHTRKAAAPVATAVLMAGAALVLWVLLPSGYVLRRAQALPGDTTRVLALSEGVNEVIAVTETPPEGRALLTNGHPMAGTEPLGQRYMRALAHIPLLGVSNPEAVLVIGFGVGNTTHAATLHPTVRRVDVVDVSGHVLAHAGYFNEANRDVLSDRRVAVHVNDGRQHLLMQPDVQYDLITLEPPPIAHAGVGSLYSREFYALARTRLKPGGYLSQWLPVYQVPPSAALALIRAFVDVFPQAVLLSGAKADLILLGARDAPAEIDPERLAAALSKAPAVQADLQRLSLGSVREIVGTFIGSSQNLTDATRNAAVVTDDRPIQEYSVRSLLNIGRSSQMTDTPSLLDLTQIPAWCPRCFVDGKPVALVEGIDIYLTLLDQFYTGMVREPPAAPFGSRTINGSAYLGSVLSDSAVVHSILGIDALNHGSVDHGLVELQEALRIDPNLASAHWHLGRALAPRARTDAIQHLRRAVELAPDNMAARYDLAVALLEAGHDDEALRHFKVALPSMPDAALAYNGVGVALASHGRFADAVEQLREAVRLKPTYVEAYNNLGTALASQGKREEAVAQFERALTLRPEYAEARRNLGIVQRGVPH